MCRSGRHRLHGVLVPGDRDHDLTGMQMQPGFAETRTVAVNVVADNGPAHRRGVYAQLMGAAGDRFEREPRQALAAAQHLPVGERGLALRVRLLPPASLGVEPAERHVDDALVLGWA